MKLMYVDVHHLNPLIKWLRTRPSGELQILIGGSDDAPNRLAICLINEGHDLVQWMYAKLQRKELLIYPILGKTTTLEVGIVVESENHGKTTP